MSYSMPWPTPLGKSGISIVKFALSFVLVAVFSHPHNYQVAANQKKINMEQATASHKRNDASTDRVAIRPFRVNIPDEALLNLRRRIAATRWPTTELLVALQRLALSQLAFKAYVTDVSLG